MSQSLSYKFQDVSEEVCAVVGRVGAISEEAKKSFQSRFTPKCK